MKALCLIICVSLCFVSKAGPDPKLFADGIVSTRDFEFGGTFSPDGNIFFYAKKSPSTLSSSTVVICFSTKVSGHWSEPEVAPFSGKFKDYNPRFSPDGTKLFFTTNRTVDGNRKGDPDIWMVEKTATGWSEAKPLPAPINSGGFELACSLASDGTFYFSSWRGGKSVELYKSKFEDGAYTEPEVLTGASTDANETDPFIAPDQSFILFSSKDREDATTADQGAIYPRSDLYISFNKEGVWTSPKNLGPAVNTAAEESHPFLSADGKTLFFTSERGFVTLPMPGGLSYDAFEEKLHSTLNGLGNIFEVDVESILK